jgi:hypothetical protein
MARHLRFHYQLSAEDPGREPGGECRNRNRSLPLKCHGREPGSIDTGNSIMAPYGAMGLKSACTAVLVKIDRR